MPRNKRDARQASKAAGFINISFISKKRLEDDLLSDEELLLGAKLSVARGAPLFNSAKDDKVMEAIVDKRYDDIEEYLKDVDTSIDDPECPTLETLMTVAVRVYSTERHEDLFGSADGVDDDDEF